MHTYIVYQQMRGDDTKTYHQPDARETEQIWTKIWQRREHNKKAKWISNMKKELEGPEDCPKAEIHIDLQKKKKHKKKRNNIKFRKRQAMMEYIDSGSRNWPPLKTNTRNEQMPTRSTLTRMDNQRKNHIDTEGPSRKSSQATTDP